MIFYELEILSAPKIRFACSVDIEKNRNRFEYIENFLEICVIEKGRSIHKNFDGTEDAIFPGMVSAVTSDMGFDCISVEGERQCHTTVGVEVVYRLNRHNSDDADIKALRERMNSSQIILIPWAEMLGESYHRAINIIRNISYLHICNTPSDEIRAIGQWYTLTALLTDFVLKKLDNIDTAPSEEMYVHKAVEYINSHLTEKITVGDIARFLQISDGYLHRIFKKIKGTGIVAYINQQRITATLSLMENRHLSMKDAAYNVGIDDPAYMSRLFRNVMGMSLREYLAQQNEKVKSISL